MVMVRIIKRELIEEASGTVSTLKNIVRRMKKAGYEVRDYYQCDSGIGKLFKVTPSTDLMQTATITDSHAFTNPNADRDWNTGTFASLNLTNATQYRIYDLGSVQTIYLYVNLYTGADIGVHYSTDNTTYNSLAGTTTSGGTINAVYKVTARYIRIYHSSTYNGVLRVYEIIAFTENPSTLINDFSVNSVYSYVLSNTDTENFLIVFDPIETSTLAYSLNKSSVREIVKEVQVI
jgi:hypothetical protein